jgi:hypothetical protein
MQIDESVQVETAQDKSIKVFFAVALTVIYALAEATFVHDLHILRIHNALTDSLLSAVDFQLSLLISFLFYLLTFTRPRIVRIGETSWTPSTLQISMAVMFLLMCLIMERHLAVAVYEVQHAIAP